MTALRKAHSTLLTPPPIVAADEARLARWKPRVRREVDWDSIEEEGGETGAHVGENGMGEERKSRRGKGKGRDKEPEEFVVRTPSSKQDGEEQEGMDAQGNGDEDPFPYLTVGLIGASSLDATWPSSALEGLADNCTGVGHAQVSRMSASRRC